MFIKIDFQISSPICCIVHIDVYYCSILSATKWIVLGDLHGVDDISVFSSIEKNAYDHITATYYLLAERMLRKQKDVAARKPGNSPAGPHTDNKPALAPLALSPRLVI